MRVINVCDGNIRAADIIQSQAARSMSPIPPELRETSRCLGWGLAPASRLEQSVSLEYVQAVPGPDTQRERAALCFDRRSPKLNDVAWHVVKRAVSPCFEGDAEGGHKPRSWPARRAAA